jgi:uncharacterized radical SAM superfamily protein
MTPAHGKKCSHANFLLDIMVARYLIHILVLVVLMPLLGTPMARVHPPPLEEVEAFFVRSREQLPHTPLTLGCARPGGIWKEIVDRLAVDSGLNGIAYPANGTVAHARRRGLCPCFHETCCGVEWVFNKAAMRSDRSVTFS